MVTYTLSPPLEAPCSPFGLEGALGGASEDAPGTGEAIGGVPVGARNNRSVVHNTAVSSPPEHPHYLPGHGTG